MNERIGAGMIGTAHSHARGHLEAIRRSENYTFIAAAEPNPELLAKARSEPRWGGVKWVSVEELLADKSIQMICIETDPLEALYYSLLSIEAGKHTKIDKPPGMNLGLLRKVYQEAERRHLFVQMGFVFRYNPAFRLAHRVMQENWLGPLRSVICQMNGRLTPGGRRRLDRYPGGQMFEICCHMINPLVWLLGKPVRVSPTLRHSDPDNDDLEDDVTATFEFGPPHSQLSRATRETATAIFTSTASTDRFRSMIRTGPRCSWPSAQRMASSPLAYSRSTSAHPSAICPTWTTWRKRSESAARWSSLHPSTT